MPGQPSKANPYVLPYVRPHNHNDEEMGPQSQNRLTLEQRKHRLQASNNFGKKRKGEGQQQTLFGGIAFHPDNDCPLCKAKTKGYPAPHRPHHPLCWNNKRTRGIVSATTLAQQKIDKELQKHFNTPLQAAEKGSWRHSTVEAGEKFFAPRSQQKKQILSNQIRQQ
jgi:hypothetical protein